MLITPNFFGTHCEGLTRWDANSQVNGWPGDYLQKKPARVRLWDLWDDTGRFDSGIYWKNLNPAPGIYYWDHLDACIAVLAARGITAANTTLAMGFTPEWSNAAGATNRPPDDLDVYFGFCWELASRYAGKIGAYELWNEPNDDPYENGYYWADTPAALAYMTLQGAYTLKDADPMCRILSPSIQGNGGGWLGEYFAAEPALADVVDAIAVHYYELGSWKQFHENTLAALAPLGINKPFQLTEVGYSDGADVSGPAYLTKAMLYPAAYGLECLHEYSPDDTVTGSLVNFTADGDPTTPNASAAAWDRVYQWIIGKDVGPVAYGGASAQIKKIVLKKTGWEGWACWNDSGSSNMPIPAGKYKSFLVPGSDAVTAISPTATAITINRTPKLLSTSATWPV